MNLILFPAGNYLFKVNNRNTRTRCEICSKQRNFRVSLLRKAKRNYFKNVKMQVITDNKKFWKTVRSYFSDKGYNQNKITIIEKDSIL